MATIWAPVDGVAASRVAASRVPLRWLTAGELRPIPFRSGGKTEDLVYKDSLGRQVVGGHGTHLALAQHRHRLHPGQRPPRRPKALKAEHRPGSALHAPVVLLDPVVEPAAAPVPREAP